jgi:helix-turn-helix protein
MGSFTNKDNQNDPSLKEYFQKQIDKEADEKKRLA